LFTMPRVQVLPDHVANQIAAGEVIERPASVIKELVENSIDAGATKLEVEFKKGGTTYMRIEDNGCGMSKEDALLSLERHATSKIREADDLNSLMSMGFRGEALPSIASVSRFQLQTKEADAESGTEILVDGGKMVHAKDCGMPQGARITISKLFNTVPVRRKFLKSMATEAAHIVHNMRLYALAHPHVAITLIDNGRVIFQSHAREQLADRVGEIFGKSIANNLLPIDVEDEGMRLWGLIGKPGQSRSSRHEMLMFVNNRPVESRTMGYALVESYYGHIPKGRYPIAFLFLELKPHLVDVNVHPAKREIRFRNEAKVRGFAVRAILAALRDALGETAAAAPVPVVEIEREVEAPVVEVENSAPARATGKTAARSVVKVELPAASKKVVEQKRGFAAEKRETERKEEPSFSREEKEDKSSIYRENKFEQNWNYLGWAQREFAIFDTGSGVVLLNVKAAQQRIWYERLIRSYEDRSVESQKLLLAVPVEFDPIAAVAVSENIDFLEAHGFEVSPFGRNFFRIEGVPSWLPDGDGESYLRELADLLREGSVSEKKRSLAKEAIAKHGAEKATCGMKELSEGEIDPLLDQLFACRNPLADIEGRPTYIELPRSEIDRRFQRNGRKRAQELF
ncbi:MAG: DNA mismatch repair endonuclease MutL, partial [Verrucomicrobiota bacterium]